MNNIYCYFICIKADPIQDIKKTRILDLIGTQISTRLKSQQKNIVGWQSR